MTSEFTFRAEAGSYVGSQIGKHEGPLIQYSTPARELGADDIRRLLAEHIAELRHAIHAAEKRSELSPEASKAAQLELDAATAKVRSAERTDRSRLAAALDMMREALTGGLGILAQLAAVVTAVKGL